MYNKLYNLWKNEEKEEIQPLSQDVYSEIKAYLQNLRSEFESLDKNSLKAKLKLQEINRAKQLAKDLIFKRFQKFAVILYDKKIDESLLTKEEKTIYDSLKQIAKQVEKLTENMIEGKTGNINKLHDKTVIRFLQEAPAIVGSDMKIYGPFKPEDIASIPIKNVENLIKWGVAKQVDLQ